MEFHGRLNGSAGANHFSYSINCSLKFAAKHSKLIANSGEYLHKMHSTIGQFPHSSKNRKRTIPFSSDAISFTRTQTHSLFLASLVSSFASIQLHAIQFNFVRLKIGAEEESCLESDKNVRMILSTDNATHKTKRNPILTVAKKNTHEERSSRQTMQGND